MSNVPQQPDASQPQMTDKQAHQWAMLCHLSALAGYAIPVLGNVIGPLVMWQLKKDDHPFVNDQGKEALNFQIALMIYALVSAVLIACVVGIVLLPAVLIFGLVMMIIAALKANEGVAYRYPLIFRLVK